MKTRVYLKRTLWKKTETPLFTFEIEPMRYWKSWDNKWVEDEQAENEKPETNTNYHWNNVPGWDEITAFNNEHLNPEGPNPDKWNSEEWDQQQQNMTWLDTGGLAVPDFIITALANINHFWDKALAWLTLHVPVLTIPWKSLQKMNLKWKIHFQIMNPLLYSNSIGLQTILVIQSLTYREGVVLRLLSFHPYLLFATPRDQTPNLTTILITTDYYTP